MLADARGRLDRLAPQAAFEELVDRQARLVDIRPAAQRLVEGEVAAWLRPRVGERNVLEWRFDPRSDARLPEAAYDLRVLVLCQESYTSSLAADSLHRLGVLGATDIVGGFRAWREAGLPVASAEPAASGSRPTEMRIALRVAVASLILTASGCGSDEAVDPGSGGDLTKPTAIPAASGPVTGLGTVIGGDSPELCLGAVAESWPPQCSASRSSAGTGPT